MAVSSIGIQQILPRTGTAWQAPAPATDRPDSGDDANPPPVEPVRAPPMPGTGLQVDKTA